MKSNVKIILITSVVTSIIVGSSVGVGTWFGLSKKSTSSLKDRSIEWVNEFENTFVDYSGGQRNPFIQHETLKLLSEKYQVYCESGYRAKPYPSTTDETSITSIRNNLQSKLKVFEFTGTFGPEWVSFYYKVKVWLCFEYTGTTA